MFLSDTSIVGKWSKMALFKHFKSLMQFFVVSLKIIGIVLSWVVFVPSPYIKVSVSYDRIIKYM